MAQKQALETPPAQAGILNDHDILMDAPIGIFTSTPEGRYLSANPTLARMYGYESPEELIASVTDIAAQVYTDPKDREALIRLLEEQDEVFNHECQLRRKDGTTFWVSRNARAVKDREGKLVALQGFTTDITDQKSNEKALRQSEARYRRFADNAMDAFYLSNASGQIVDINARAAIDTGFSREELLGMHIWEIDAHHSKQEFVDLWSNVPDNTVKFVVSEHRRKDGTTFPAEIKAVCFTQGEDRLIYGIARDVTEKSIMTEHLKMAQASVDKTSLSVFWINPEGMFIYVNDAACASLGYSREELLRMGVWDVDPGTTREERSWYWESYQKDKQKVMIRTHKAKSGRIIPVQVTANYFKHQGQEFEFAYAQDISAFVQSEEKLKAAAARLDEAQRIGGFGDWDWNPEADTVTWSENLYALFGLQSDGPPPAYKGQLALYHPEDVPRLDQAVRCALDHGEPYILEMRLDNAKHHVTHVEVRGKVERDKLGKTTRLYGSVLDITDRKRVENELKERTALLEAILDNTPDIMSVKRPDLSVVRYNKAGYAFLNKSQEQIEGAKCYELIGRNSPCQPCATLEAVKTKQPVTFEKYVPELDMHLNCRANLILSEDGQVEYTVELIRDVTKRKRAEETLHEKTQLLDSITCTMSDLVSVTDMDGNYKYIGPSHSSLGYDLDALIGRNVMEFLHPEDYQRIENALMEFVTNREDGKKVEYRYR